MKHFVKANGEVVGAGDALMAGAILRETINDSMKAPAIRYDIQCVGPSSADREEYLYTLSMAENARKIGRVDVADKLAAYAKTLVKEQWREVFENLVTTGGKTDIVDKYLKGSAYTAAWFLGLKGTGTAAVGDTLASHAGWTEATPYSGNRLSITWGTTTSGSNTASAASYTINATATVAGAFVSSVNTGTSGILYSAGDFAASRSVASGDTLNVTPTLSVA